MYFELRKLEEGEAVKFLGSSKNVELDSHIKAEKESGEIIRIIEPKIIPEELRIKNIWIRWDGEQFVLAVCPNS